MTSRPDFWLASGHHLLDHHDGGGLIVTDEYLKAYLARPELVPPSEACPVERGIHRQLLEAPRLTISAKEISLIVDSDARENIELFLAFRDQLLKHATLEGAYLALVSGQARNVPPLFIQQLSQVIARNAFNPCNDALVVRAAECFFRAQRVTFHEKTVLLADHDAIADHENDRHNSPLLAMLGGPAISELTVLNDENQDEYWLRSDAHDFVFNLTSPKRGRHALGEAARIWIRHITGVNLVFEPVDSLSDESFGWFLAFDAESTRIGNKVWQGETLDPETASRVLALYRFSLPDDPRIEHRFRGKKAFAILATTSGNILTIKPQNLVAGLPLVQKQG